MLLFRPELQPPYLTVSAKTKLNPFVESRSLQYIIELSSQEPIRFNIGGWGQQRHHRCCHCCLFSSCAFLLCSYFLLILMPRKRESYPPSAVQKECQRVIHFIAHNKVFKMEDLTDELKRNKMYSLVHGTDEPESDQISLTYTLFTPS